MSTSDMGHDWTSSGSKASAALREDFKTTEQERDSAVKRGERSLSRALTEELCRLGRLLGGGQQ